MITRASVLIRLRPLETGRDRSRPAETGRDRPRRSRPLGAAETPETLETLLAVCVCATIRGYLRLSGSIWLTPPKTPAQSRGQSV